MMSAVVIAAAAIGVAIVAAGFAFTLSLNLSGRRSRISNAAHAVDGPIPGDLARRLGSPGLALDRQALEALAATAYQAGTLTANELHLMLGIETHHEFDGFLKARGVNNGITPEEWRHEQEAPDRLGL